MYRRILFMRRVLEKLSYDLSRINITFVQMTNDLVVFVDSQDRRFYKRICERIE
jgi:hypothetical protein